MRVLLRTEVELGRYLQVEVVVNIAGGDNLVSIATLDNLGEVLHEMTSWHAILLNASLAQIEEVLL